MPFKNVIQVSEFEKLYYDDDKPFKQKHWEALCRYLEKGNMHEERIPDYFRVINKGIQFTNYVGVLQAGNLTIEILPKTDKHNSTAVNEIIQVVKDESKQQWHHALLQMLNECSLLKVYEANLANLNLYHHSILDIYVEIFLTATAGLLHEGLIKTYEKQEENQTALRGQLLFQKQVTYNSLHDERFYVRHTVYNYNHLYNRILYKTLQLILHISNDIHISAKAKCLLAQFPQPASITVTADTLNRLSFDRKTEHYRPALLIAKMLLLNYRPDITGGRENVIAILFDMNKLWEEWVFQRLKKAESKFDIRVHRQQSTDFWKGEHLTRYKTIRPDIIIQKGDKVIIIDTKWKLITNMTPDDEDLKQMFIYNLYWNCNKSVLLYPANDLNVKEGSYKDFMKVEAVHSNCAILTTTIFKDKSLDKDFAGNVFGKIFQKLSTGTT